MSDNGRLIGKSYAAVGGVRLIPTVESRLANA